MDMGIARDRISKGLSRSHLVYPIKGKRPEDAEGALFLHIRRGHLRADMNSKGFGKDLSKEDEWDSSSNSVA